MFSFLSLLVSQKSAKKFVPVSEVRRIVYSEPEVVKVMVSSSSIEAEGHESVWRPGKVVA